MSDREYWLWISSIDFIYFDKLKKLIEQFKSVKNIYCASKKDLMIKGGLSDKEIKVLDNSRKSFRTEQYLESLKKDNIQFVCIEDKDYPQRLFPYNHKPYYLFYKGRLPDDSMPIAAMVGARACSGYGRNMAKRLARELSDNHVQIISGMARGIDTYSGLGALEGAAPVFAVLGCGVDICYPTENIELYDNILKNGGIISEYSPGSPPASWHFPQRNRIISGLADKVVVIEAKEKSGSLITVEWALEQGKDVMAVPGRVGDSLSSGCNRLIKNGAGLVTSAEDIMEELKYVVFNKADKKGSIEKTLEKEFLLLYSELSLQPKNIYELIQATGLKYERLVEMLLQLQLRGLIEQPSYNCYSRLN